MKFVDALITWTQNVFGPFGATGLFILAFMESSFFPIPVEVLLIPLCLAHPELFLWYGAVASVGSAFGGVFGYYMGHVGKKAVLYRMFPKDKIHRIHEMFVKYQDWAVFVAGFTPLPWKLVAIAGGAFYIKFWRFFVIALFSRTLRFMLVAFLTFWFGPPVVSFLNENFNLWTFIIVGVAFLVYYVYMKVKGKRAFIWI